MFDLNHMTSTAPFVRSIAIFDFVPIYVFLFRGKKPGWSLLTSPVVHLYITRECVDFQFLVTVVVTVTLVTNSPISGANL